MKDIGGYFELECGNNAPYHKDGILLNSGGNCLRYFVKVTGIKKIYVPNYTCSSVFDSLKAETCEIEFYDIDDNFMPLIDFPKDSYVVYNNYFGICGKNVKHLAETYPNLIVDNAQAFYAKLQGIASIYSPRKFFGLPDGGIILSKEKLPTPDKRDKSYDRCSHLLKRIDLGAGGGYSDFIKCDDMISEADVLGMSILTERLMGNIDYNAVKRIRLENFNTLREEFCDINILRIDLQEDDVPMVYPLLVKIGGIREKLIANKIFVARYWPNVECDFSKYILSLPIDQRYGAEDMKFIIEILRGD